MKLEFDLENIKETEFGIGLRSGKSLQYWLLAIDEGVKTTIQEMLKVTYAKMKELTQTPEQFDPSEKHESNEYLYLEFSSELAAPLSRLHQLANLSYAPNPLDDLNRSFCYYSRCTDSQDRTVTAIRRAGQLKGILKKPKFYVGSDALEFVREPIFQLNDDFDVVLDSDIVHILHPLSFKVLGDIESAISEAIPHNIQELREKLPFINWDPVQDYAIKHKRAASLLISIRTEGHGDYLDCDALSDLCNRTGVAVNYSNGLLEISLDQVIDFLEVINRRRYEVALTSKGSEQYRASSRMRIV